jgi:F-type H+-transporting ATPase subunit delta
MADRATIARPYARAAFAFARDAKDFAAWSKHLQSAAEAARDPRVARLIGHPQVTDEKLVELFDAVSGNAAGDAGQNFLGMLAENKRLALLPEISTQFEVLRAEVENVVDVEVITAREIAAPQQKRLMEALKRRLGREVRMHTRIDDTLIGGAIVRAGDLVIDGSLKGRLERLGSALTN